MMMIFLLQTTAAEGKGMCFKSSTVHIHYLFLYLQNVVLFKAGPTLVRFSGPNKTLHSWQQIITGMKSKGGTFLLFFHLHPSAPPVPAAREITSPPPSFFPLRLTHTGLLASLCYSFLARLQRKQENE